MPENARPGSDSVLSIWQLVGADLADEVDRIWPGQTIEERCMALAEEAGEVCRAGLKRNHTRRYGGTYKGKTTDEWTANLRVELAQLVGVALDIAVREGFDLDADLFDVLVTLRRMPSAENGRGG